MHCSHWEILVDMRPLTVFQSVSWKKALSRCSVIYYKRYRKLYIPCEIQVKKHVQSFLATVVIWIKVLRGLNVKPLYFPSFHLFFPLSLLPLLILPLSPTFPPSLFKSSGVGQVAIYQRNEFCDYINIVS